VILSSKYFARKLKKANGGVLKPKINFSYISRMPVLIETAMKTKTENIYPSIGIHACVFMTTLPLEHNSLPGRGDRT
jgi:hypothetical protein